MNKTIIISTFAVALVLMIGCSKNPESALIGKWECVSFHRDAITEYHEDGSLNDPEFLSDPTVKKVSWSILENGKLQYEIDAGTSEVVRVFTYKISGDRMLLDFGFERVSSGDGTTENPLIGKWKSTMYRDSSTIEFLKDGSLVNEYSIEELRPMKGHWIILKKGKMMTTDAEGSHPTTFAYSIDGDSMTRHIEFKRID